MDAIRLLRPSHWIKNLLVFVPIFFGGALDNPEKIILALIAFISFCMVASGGYALNDAIDVKTDTGHPEKKFRPLPMGRISPCHAVAIGIMACMMGFALTTMRIPAAAPVIGLYVGLSVLYSSWAKGIPILEMLFFPAFYLTRIFAGGLAAGIAISNWLIVCAIFMSLLIIAMKREAETERRLYSRKFLDRMIAIFGASALMSYGLYCILGAQSPYAIYSIALPLAGIMRYLMLAEKGDNGEYPEKTVLDDPLMAGIVVGWGIWIYVLLY